MGAARPKHTIERDTRDARYDSMYLGVRVEGIDPLGLDRIKVRVPGLLEPASRWCFPIGRMFGVKEGLFGKPRVGANVLVWLHQGNVDHPYYIAGPWGKPAGVSDVPEQDLTDEHFGFRWGDFFVLFDSTPGLEKLTIRDLQTGTRIEFDRQTGDMNQVALRDHFEDVFRDKKVEALRNHETTVLLGDRTATMVTGDDVEAMPLGSKTVTAGVSINLVAGVAVNVTAAGEVNVVGGQVNVESLGPSSSVSAGLVTKTFLGGLLGTLVGDWSETIDGLFTWTFNQLARFVGNAIQLGLGQVTTPTANNPSAGYQRMLLEDYHDLVFAPHTHPGDGLPPSGTLIEGGGDVPDPGIVAPDVDRRAVTSQHVRAS